MHRNRLDQPQRSMRTCVRAVPSRSTPTFAHNHPPRCRSCINHSNNSTQVDARTHPQATHQMATHSNGRTHYLPVILETNTDPLLAQCNGSLLVLQAGTSNGRVHQLLFHHPNHNHRASTSASPLRMMIATDGSTDLDLHRTPSAAVKRLDRLATTARLRRLLQRGRQRVVLLLLHQDLGRDHLLRQVLKFPVGNRSL